MLLGSQAFPSSATMCNEMYTVKAQPYLSPSPIHGSVGDDHSAGPMNVSMSCRFNYIMVRWWLGARWFGFLGSPYDL